MSVFEKLSVSEIVLSSRSVGPLDQRVINVSFQCGSSNRAVFAAMPRKEAEMVGGMLELCGRIVGGSSRSPAGAAATGGSRSEPTL